MHRRRDETIMLRLRTCLFVPFVVVALLGPSGVADQPATPQQFDQVRALIRERLAQSQIPSISVAVARDGKIIWEEGFGWADREKKIPANEHTMYSLASISKPITMTGLMALVQQGKVDLDRPINDYLRDAKVTARVGNAADATVRRVANHTAGLPAHLQCFYENEPFRPPKMSDTISRYGILITPPGEQFNYSNLGYGILSHLIEQVSGQDFGDFMLKKIFQPLNLPHMSVVSLNVRPENIGQAALRYGDDGQPLPFFTSDHPGASDIYSCVHDLVRFGMVHLKEHLADQKVVLSDRFIDEMQKTTVSVDGIRFGAGWMTDDTSTGYQIVNFSGGMPGVRAVMEIIPSKRVVVVVLENSWTRSALDISRGILTTLIPDLYGQDQKQPRQGEPEPWTELAGTWTGTVHTYKSDIPFQLVIDASGNVRARLGTEPETALSNARVLPDGRLTGEFSGDLGTEDLKRYPYKLFPYLKQRGEVLNGGLTAGSNDGKRARFELAHWVELRRRPKAP